MKILKCNHVTATERKHLVAFLESGMNRAKVNRKHYEILSGEPSKDGWIYEIRITTPRKNDYGCTVFDHQMITLLK